MTEIRRLGLAEEEVEIVSRPLSVAEGGVARWAINRSIWSCRAACWVTRVIKGSVCVCCESVMLVRRNKLVVEKVETL